MTSVKGNFGSISLLNVFLLSRFLFLTPFNAGLLAHGAVCAREYGIPCVVNVRGACKHLNTGDRVTLDGGKGTISILKSVIDE